MPFKQPRPSSGSRRFRVYARLPPGGHAFFILPGIWTSPDTVCPAAGPRPLQSVSAKKQIGGVIVKNYQDSDYALNKFSKGVVYRFATSISELTLEAFLASDPDLAEEDFYRWKTWSDADYLTQVNTENTQTYKNVPFDALEGSALCSVPSPEATLIDVRDAREAERETELRRKRLTVANRALDKLTDVQRRRYLLHAVEGLTTREIAEKDGVSHVAIVYSLEFAKKKIKKFLSANAE